MANFFMDCNNAGAEFTHVVARAVFVSDIIEPRYISDIISSLFQLSVGASNFDGIGKSVVALQVTGLIEGLFIGCSANHDIMDGTSFWHFIKSWLEIYRGLRSIVDDGDDIILILLPTPEKNFTGVIIIGTCGSNGACKTANCFGSV
ncbi:hypothetical protein OROHE_007188 [Orobanche hederae]